VNHAYQDDTDTARSVRAGIPGCDGPDAAGRSTGAWIHSAAHAQRHGGRGPAVYDEARFERYRDDRSGLSAAFTLNRLTDQYLFDASASRIGYRDQRYNASFLGYGVRFAFEFASLPLNYSYQTRTPYTRASSNDAVLVLDDNAQRAVQGLTNATNDGTAVGVPCAPGAPPAACGTPGQADLAKANRSIYNGLASVFNLEHRRDTASFGLRYAATREIDVDASFVTAGRGGTQPWGASFAFNTAVELPQPLDQRTNDFSVGASWARPNAMLRIGWDGSWFNNAYHSLVWDNPIRITDFNNGLAPPLGPYDPSGYSNGNGAAIGRMALAPDNMMHVVSVMGLYKLPGRRTTVNGAVHFTSQTQDEELIPWTSNTLINGPEVIAAFPRLAQLPRPTAEAEARGVNTLLSLNSRFLRRLTLNLRYRYNDRDVQTPPFDASEYVRFDAVPEEIDHGISHQFDTSRQNFDANVSFTPTGWGTVRAGYGYEAIDRQGRGFADVGEHIFRLSYDMFTWRYVTVRAGLDVSRRRGDGFVEAESGDDEAEVLLGPGGTQPTLRYYDEADRNRVRGSLVFSVIPRDTVDVFLQFAGARDRYLADDFVPVSRPGELFGLERATNTSWALGVNYHPTDVLNLGASYGRDTYGSFQLSRNANPPPDPSWTDPQRNWSLDNDDRIDNVSLYVDLLRAVRDTDIRFGYDYSDSVNSYEYGGPRIAALASIGQFIPLPNVENSWHRIVADVQYFLNERTAVAFGYYFEKLNIVDWNTIDEPGPVGFAPATGEPRIDWLGGLITGYGNRPYTGHSVRIRALYRF
jgi:MtrB/PioB family decaheme-associated outer membrane protein